MVQSGRPVESGMYARRSPSVTYQKHGRLARASLLIVLLWHTVGRYVLDSVIFSDSAFRVSDEPYLVETS